MNEESFKKVLYLIFKVLIKNNGFLSQLEIFKYVRILLGKSFNIKETDLTVKLGQGKNEDFKDILNFTLTILCELDLVSEKMENKSFYFKWNSMKGFYKKYNEMFKKDKEYEISESIEHRSQIYTRYFLLYLYKNKDKGITSNDIDGLISKCGLDGQFRYAEKIHVILHFISFIDRVAPNKEAYYQLFTLVKDKNGIHQGTGGFSSVINPNQVLYKINEGMFQDEIFVNKTLNEQELIALAESFNMSILSKGIELNEKNDSDDENQKDDSNFIDINSGDGINGSGSKNMLLQKKTDSSNKSNYLSNQPGLLYYRMSTEAFNNENDDVGFAMLRGINWVYYIKKLHCIIGRKPMKYNKPTNPTNTTWEIDVDLSYGKKISKQHALIVYNFIVGSFEIKNLSKKFPIKVNGELMNYNEEMPLLSKSYINIGNQDFYFLLP